MQCVQDPCCRLSKHCAAGCLSSCRLASGLATHSTPPGPLFPAWQDIFNLLPNTSVDALVHSLAVKTNDMALVVYLASLIRAVIALHKLIDNKEARLWREREAAKAKEVKAEAKGGEGEKEKGEKADGAAAGADKGKGKDGKEGKPASSKENGS